MSSLPKSRGRCLTFILSGILWANLSACSYSRVRVDRLPSARARLTKGVSSYAEVMKSFGPPHDIEKRSDGFNFRYEELEAKEYKATLDYRNARLSASMGDIKHRRLIILFDDDGRYLSSNVETMIRDTGWGGIVGHTGIDSPFFNARNYSGDDKNRGRWGAFLLDRKSDHSTKKDSP